jgi:diaminopimelate decarboxylase
MDYWTRSPDGLRFDGAPLEPVAAEFGTPLYVYSADIVAARYRALDAAFAGRPHRLLYSVKANANGALLRLLAGLGAGADVVSGGELERASRAGIPPARIVFAGAGKTDDELRLAVSRGVHLVQVESPGELERLARIAAGAGAGTAGRPPVDIAFRVTPGVVGGTHQYTETGTAQTKFGMPADRALELARGRGFEPSLRLVGLHAHFGSQITSVEPFAQSARRMAALVREFREAGAPIRSLNLGGGLGIRYAAEEPPHPGELAEALAPALDGLDVELLLEPGRWIVGPAGLLLARVVDVKRTGTRTFVVVDAAMNDLIRPALYDAHHEVLPVRPRPGAVETIDLVGPICETGDFLARGRDVPPLEAGDLVALRDTGAYGFSMASNYNSRPRPAEVLLEDGRARLVRRRETIDDLVRGELA